jgi:hypothetical protein
MGLIRPVTPSVTPSRHQAVSDRALRASHKSSLRYEAPGLARDAAWTVRDLAATLSRARRCRDCGRVRPRRPRATADHPDPRGKRFQGDRSHPSLRGAFGASSSAEDRHHLMHRPCRGDLAATSLIAPSDALAHGFRGGMAAAVSPARDRRDPSVATWQAQAFPAHDTPVAVGGNGISAQCLEAQQLPKNGYSRIDPRGR